MPVNIRLLKKVRKLIAEEPRRLRMTTWGRKLAKHEKERPSAPPCGTVACLAGWTIIAAEPDALKQRRIITYASSRGEHVADIAARLLGLGANSCPFWEFKWKAPEVLAWIDRQIDAASK